MKLQKRFLREYKGKKYYKFMINIAPELIKKLGFKAGDELKVDVKGGKLVIGFDRDK